MLSTPGPALTTHEKEPRDGLLQQISHQMSAATSGASPTPEELQHAKWNLIFADQEYRLEQIKASRQDQYWKAWQVFIPAVTASAALLAAGFAFAKLFS